MNVEIGTETPMFLLLGIFVSKFRYFVFAVQCMYHVISSELGPGGGGGHTCLRVRGWGNPNSDDWRNSLALCLYSVGRCLYIDKTVQRGGREMGGERKQTVLHTVQLETRI
jgi:hypothetical protein